VVRKKGETPTVTKATRPKKDEDEKEAKQPPLVERPPVEGSKQVIRFGLICLCLSAFAGCPEAKEEAKEETTASTAEKQKQKKADEKADSKAETKASPKDEGKGETPK